MEFDSKENWSQVNRTIEQDGCEMLSMENFSATWYKSFSEVSARLALPRNPDIVIAHDLFDDLLVY